MWSTATHGFPTFPKPLSSTLSTCYTTPSLCPTEQFYQLKSTVLMNDLHQVQLQKQYYRNKLHTEARTSHEQLQSLYKTINQKEHMIVNLQEQLERERKQLRIMSDDYLHLKREAQSQREMWKKEVGNKERQGEERVLELRHKLQNEHEIAMSKKVQEMERMHEDVLRIKDKQIQDLSKASEGIIAQFRKLQDDHKLLLVKVDSMVQDELHNQLRKRDRDERERYSQDMAYREALKKENDAMREEVVKRQEEVDRMRREMGDKGNEVGGLKKEVERLTRELEEMRNRKATPAKISEDEEIVEHPESYDAYANTHDQYLPIPTPTNDLQLILLLQSLQQFLGQALLQLLSQLFSKSSSQTLKSKNPHSLNIFTLNLKELRQTRREISLIVYTYTKLKEILSTYSPAHLHDVSLVTLKENFIRNCLEQCEGLRNKPVQQLYRLLELRQRVIAPMNHTKTMENLSEQGKRVLEGKIVEASWKALMG